MTQDDTLEAILSPEIKTLDAPPQEAPETLACCWVIDATTGRPVCYWSLETWRPRAVLK